MSYTPFKQMESKLAARGATNPGALAAYIARKKYGGKAVAHAAATGHSLRNAKPLKRRKKGKHHAAISKFVSQHGGK